MLTEEEWQAMPPGSDAAIAKGCTCPRMDNCHGEGFLWKGKKAWWIHMDCPLHRSTWDLPSSEGEENADGK